MKYYKYIFIFILCISFKIQSDQTKTVSYIFSDENTNQIVMNIEAALARAQASQGIIPNWAAEEITKKANINYMPIEEIIIENELIRHRLVSRLNVWKRSLDNGAEEYLHFCATTQQTYTT